jgi:MFS family permease
MNIGDSTGGGLSIAEKVTVIVAGILAALALTAISSVLPLIAADLAKGPGDGMLVKQLIGAVGLAMVLGSALGGFLADRMGRRRLLLMASIIYVVAGTAGLYLESLPSLLVSRLILGLAAATIQVTAITLVNARCQGADRAKWMGYHVSGALFGTIAVHPIAGFLGTYSWRLPFALYAVAIIMVFAMLRAQAEPEAKLQPADTAPVREPGFWKRFPFGFIPLAFCVGATVFLPSVYLPFLLRETHGASPLLISAVLTADSIVGALVALGFGLARQRISSGTAFAISFAFIAGGSLLAVFASTLFGIVTGMLIYGLGVGWLVPNLLSSLASKVGPAEQGRTTGIVKGAHFLAAPLCVVIAEPFARQHGASAALLMTGLLAAALFAFFAVRSVGSRVLSVPASAGGSS